MLWLRPLWRQLLRAVWFARSEGAALRVAAAIALTTTPPQPVALPTPAPVWRSVGRSCSSAGRPPQATAMAPWARRVCSTAARRATPRRWRRERSPAAKTSLETSGAAMARQSLAGRRCSLRVPSPPSDSDSPPIEREREPQEKHRRCVRPLAAVAVVDAAARSTVLLVDGAELLRHMRRTLQ